MKFYRFRDGLGVDVGTVLGYLFEVFFNVLCRLGDLLKMTFLHVFYRGFGGLDLSDFHVFLIIPSLFRLLIFTRILGRFLTYF